MLKCAHIYIYIFLAILIWFILLWSFSFPLLFYSISIKNVLNFAQLWVSCSRPTFQINLRKIKSIEPLNLQKPIIHQLNKRMIDFVPCGQQLRDRSYDVCSGTPCLVLSCFLYFQAFFCDVFVYVCKGHWRELIWNFAQKKSDMHFI